MAHPADSDPDLLARFRDGDPDAFRSLVRPLLPDLEAYARRRLDDRVRRKVSAADVVQEAQMIAFRRCGDFEGNDAGELRRWLFGIVNHRAAKAIARYAGTDKRNLAREASRGQRPPTLELLAGHVSPSVDAANGELLALLALARERLGRDEQELLRLVHEEHLNLREVADRLGRTYEAIRKQHARALMRLGRAFHRLRGSHDDPV